MELHIDTTRKDISELLIIDDSGHVIDSLQVPDRLNESPLMAVHTLFTNSQVSLESIERITVNEGPGTRFTRTRMGVTLANALGFALGVDVNDQEFAKAAYHRQPNITESKNKA